MGYKKGNINEKKARVEIGLEGSIIKDTMRAVLEETNGKDYIDYETLFQSISEALIKSMKKWTSGNGRGSRGFSHFFHTKKRRDLKDSYVARGAVTRILMNGRKMEKKDIDELVDMADAITDAVEMPLNIARNGNEIFSEIENRILEFPLTITDRFGKKEGESDIDIGNLRKKFETINNKIKGTTKTYTAYTESRRDLKSHPDAIGKVNTYKFVVGPYDEKGKIDGKLASLFEIPEYMGRDYRKTISVVIDEGLRILNEKLFSDKNFEDLLINNNLFHYDRLSIEASAEASAEVAETDSKNKRLFRYMRRIREDFPFSIVRDSAIEPIELEKFTSKENDEPIKVTGYAVNLRIKQNFVPENTEKYVTTGWRYLKESPMVRRIYPDIAEILENLERKIGLRNGRPTSSLSYRIMKGTVFAYLIDMAYKCGKQGMEKDMEESLRSFWRGSLYAELAKVSAASAMESVVSMHVNAFVNSAYVSDEREAMEAEEKDVSDEKEVGEAEEKDVKDNEGIDEEEELKELLKEEFAVSYEAINEVISAGDDVKAAFGLRFTDYLSGVLNGSIMPLEASDECSRVIEILESVAMREEGEKYLSSVEKFLKIDSAQNPNPVAEKRKRLSVLAETIFAHVYKTPVIIPFEKLENEEGIGVRFEPSLDDSLTTKAKARVIPQIDTMVMKKKITKSRHGYDSEEKATLVCVNVYGSELEKAHNAFTLFKRKYEPGIDDLNMMIGFSDNRLARRGGNEPYGVRDSLMALFHYYRYLVLVLLMDSYRRKGLFEEMKSLECFVDDSDMTDTLMRMAMNDLRFFFPFDTKGISFESNNEFMFYMKLETSLTNLLRSKKEITENMEEEKVRYIIAPVYESLSSLEVLDPKTGKTESSSPDKDHMVIFYTKIESRPDGEGNTERSISRGYVLTENGLKKGCLKIFENDGYEPDRRVFIFKKTRAFTDKDFRAISEFLEGRGEDEENPGFCGHCILSDTESRHIESDDGNMAKFFEEKRFKNSKEYQVTEVIVRPEGRRLMWTKAELWRTVGFHPESRFKDKHGIFRTSLVFKTRADSKKYVEILEEIESEGFSVNDVFGKKADGKEIKKRVSNRVAEFLADEIFSTTMGLTGKIKEDFSFSFFRELEESTTYANGQSVPYMTVHAESVDGLPNIEYRISGIPILHDLLSERTHDEM